MATVTVEANKRIAGIIKEFWNNRLGFVRHIIGVEPTPQQVEALTALDTDDFIAIKSGIGCHAIDTPIVMYGGFIRPVQDVVVGDTIMGDDSTPRTVLALYRGREMMYSVKYCDGSYYDINESHILSLISTGNHGRIKKGQIENVPLKEWFKWSNKKKALFYGYKRPIELPVRKLKIPPYILGIWLGDGDSAGTPITNPDKEIRVPINKYASENHLDVIDLARKFRFNIKGRKWRNNQFLDALRHYNLINNKHIPEDYLTASRQQRLELLAGIIDADGWLDKRNKRVFNVVQKNKWIAKQIVRLAQSVGVHATFNEIKKICMNGINKNPEQYYSVNIMRNVGIIPIKIMRKKADDSQTTKNGRDQKRLHFSFTVEALGEDDYYGFELDKNHLYLLGDCTVTHNTGKSTMMAWMILHYMSCRPAPKIVCTSPSKDQLRNVLWPELLKWHNKMNSLFSSQFVWRKESYVHKDHEEWFAVARTATKDNPEAMQGLHSEYLLRILDEGSGIPEEVFEVIEGATGTKETKELLCGNPTRLDGTFFDAFNKSAEFYKTFSWSSLDSPIRPERVIERIRRKYGEDSNMWLVRVLGQFPRRDGDSYIPYDWAMDALNRDIPSQKDFPKVFGCDIARYGADATVIAVRQGDEFLPYHILRNKSTMETAAYIAYLANKEKPVAIFVDSIGVGGGVVDRLEELSFPVIGVNVAESPALDGQKYKRLRDELWGQMRDWFEARKGKIWDNQENDLVGELTSVKYRILSNGKIQVETKDEMKKRGLESPNLADSAIMTFAQPVSNYVRETEEFWADVYGGGAREPEYALDAEAGY